jgi:hypothetical protein
MQSRCSRKRCAWILEVAHMDEALDQLHLHYRAVHPTKGFYRSREIESLESYNLTPDEYMESYNIGSAENPEYDWRTLRNQIQRTRENEERFGGFIAPAVVDELERRINEHYDNQPQAEQAPENLNLQWRGEVQAGDVVPPLGNAYNEAIVDVILEDSLEEVLPEDGGNE